MFVGYGWLLPIAVGMLMAVIAALIPPSRYPVLRGSLVFSGLWGLVIWALIYMGTGVVSDLAALLGHVVEVSVRGVIFALSGVAQMFLAPPIAAFGVSILPNSARERISDDVVAASVVGLRLFAAWAIVYGLAVLVQLALFLLR